MKCQVEASLKTTSENHRKKLEKLSERQDKPLGGRNEHSVKVSDDTELPGWVHEVLSMGSKHPIRDKFNKTPFLADIDIFRSQLKNRKISGEKTRKMFKDNGLLAVPFDKEVGFCKTRKQKYESKLDSLLQSAQFVKKMQPLMRFYRKLRRKLTKNYLTKETK